jgi:hypothetical protein
MECKLPPLILHPFSDSHSAGDLADASRVALILSGLLPEDGENREALNRKLLRGKYLEIRMLYYLGKDVHRWMEQCTEMVQRIAELAATGIAAPSFAVLLTRNPPENVHRKLTDWGVCDYPAIFSRAVALHLPFRDLPSFELLGEDFVRNYHHYADHLFDAYLEAHMAAQISPADFQFELYASGEYTRMLESQWSTE